MLALVAVGTFMTTLDSSVVSISLPAIARAFDKPLSGAIEWVVIAYLVVIAALLLTFGRLSDMIGRKPIFVVGLVIFTLGSVTCGFAASLPQLIAARAFQGIGGALIFAPSVALLTDAFPMNRRGQAIGFNAVAVALGVSVGPSLGGVITEHLTWRWIFFLNVPVGIVATVMSARWLSRGERKPEHFDPVGALLLAFGLSGVMLALSFEQEWGWLSPLSVGCVVVGVLCLVSVVWIERRVPQPNIDLRLFEKREFSAPLVSLVLSFVALFAVGFLMPFYFENLRRLPPDQSGYLLTPLPLAIGVVAPVSGALADRIGSRWLASAGLGVTCLGLFLLSQLEADSTPLQIIWRLALVGVGTGIFQSPNNRALMQAAPGAEQGEASGLLGTGRVVGQSLSVAIAAAVFGAFGGIAANSQLSAENASQTLGPDRLAALQQTFLAGLHAALIVSGCVAAVGIVTSLVRGKSSRAEGRHSAESVADAE